MGFYTYTTLRDWARRTTPNDHICNDIGTFYRELFADAHRRPHMTLVWTGHGRTVPRIVPRKGSVVHREVVEKVPMGWEG